MVQTPDYLVAIPLLVAGLIVVAVGIGVHTLLKERGKKVSVGGAASHLLALLWLIPIVGVCLVVALPAALFFSFSVHSVEVQELHQIGRAETHQIATTLVAESSPSELAEAQSTLPELTEGEAESSLPELTEGEAAAEPKRPTWVDAGDVIDGSRRLVVVQGQQFPQEQRARQDALEEAVRLVRADFQKTHNPQGRWTLYRSLVKRKAVKKTFVEPIQRSTGLNEFSVVRVYHQVELSDDVRNAIYPSWRGQIVDSRLWVLGGLLGFITLMLGTAATYLRLDMLTKGNYRRRLKLASVSLIVAGGLGLAAFLRLA
jgi:hypothetical protein